jgi:hypothetical protein
MAVLGSDKYVRELQSMYDLFAANNPELRPFFANTPLYQRYEIYRGIGLVTDILTLQQELDINRVVLP